MTVERWGRGIIPAVVLSATIAACSASTAPSGSRTPTASVAVQSASNKSTSRIEGLVVGDSDQQRSAIPLAGAVVSLTLLTSPDTSVAKDTLPVVDTSGAGGKFAFSRLSAGTYIVAASPPPGAPYLPSAGTLVTVRSGGSVKVNVVLQTSTPTSPPPPPPDSA